MIVELHMLQNFAPSNLNRDDTGMPKDCEFGGYRRARISSQALKRAVRMSFDKMDLIAADTRAKRSKRFVERATELLTAQGKSVDDARRAISMALASVGIMTGLEKEEVLTEYLLFLGDTEVHRLGDYCLENWDTLVASHMKLWGEGWKKPAKDKARKEAPAGSEKAVKSILDGGKAAAVALFGRMLADLPDSNKYAASQVAHAISTNHISMELDYYTAVDDLNPEDTAGAGMIGTVGFNSACFYRYANVDMGQLNHNFQGDEELSQRILEAFIRASVNAVPTGKQNSMAAHNPPSFVLAVVRRSSLWNLANAFLKPVAPEGGEDLALRSIKALDSYWGKLVRMYGDEAVVGKWVVSLEEDGVDNLKASTVPSIDALVENVLTGTQV